MRVRATNFPYLKRYPMLVLRNPAAEKQGVAGYDIALNYNGVAFALMPRAPSEIKSTRQDFNCCPSTKPRRRRIRAGTSSSSTTENGNWPTRASAKWNC